MFGAAAGDMPRIGVVRPVDVVDVVVEDADFIGREIDIDAADCVDHGDGPVEVDDDVVRNRRVEIRVDGLESKRRAAVGVGRIELAVAVAGNGQIGVPHQRSRFDFFVLVVAGDDHHRVRPGAVDVRTGVDAEQGHVVDALAAGFCGRAEGDALGGADGYKVRQGQENIRDD